MASATRPPSKWQIAFVVGFYMSAALVMVFVNKAVLTSAPTLPLTFLFLQLFLAVLFLHLAALISSDIAKSIPRLNQITQQTRDKWSGLWKVVLVNAIGLVFNTLCLRDVDASFFQIARGLVLPLTILVSSVVTRSRPSAKVILAASCVTLGFLLGVAPSLSPSLIRDPAIYLTQLSNLKSKLYASPLSLFYGFLSSLFIALHAVFIKSSLPVVDNSAIALAWWSNAGGMIMLFPMALLNGEATVLAQMVHNGDFGSSNGTMFVIGSLVTGFVGFLLCVAGLLSIKVTSPITHMFSSAARSVLQTLLGVWIFSDILTVNRALSILVILSGTMYYTWVKTKEAATPKPEIENQRDLERGQPKQGILMEETEVLASPSNEETIWEIGEKEEESRRN